MDIKTIKEYNRKALTLFSAFLNLCPDEMDGADVKEIAQSCSVSEDYAYAVLLAAFCGLVAEGKDKVFFDGWFVPAIRKRDPDVFLQDPYYQSICVPEMKTDRWQFKMMEIKSYEAFVCGDLKCLADGKIQPQLGFFEKPFRYPAVLENGREWMTITPNEIVTMAKPVKEASGRVLTFGLGLGYFAYMTARKSTVDSVTIVEKDQEVIDLFERFILPQFETPEKIKIVHADAFQYAKDEMQKGSFNFVFTDIWHDPSDGVDAYMQMKKFETKLPAASFSYWIEETLKCYLASL
ncbi:MAG: hypothetical protein HFE77_06165 [Clostridiales bacterium]|nr:hypothetical protein [Clostridiales bacterium]